MTEKKKHKPTTTYRDRGKLDDQTRDKILEGVRLGWSMAACAAHAGVGRETLANWIERGRSMREHLHTGVLKTLPRAGSLERATLDLFDLYRDAQTYSERRNVAVLQRSAEGYWTPDHRWQDVVDDNGRPVLDLHGRPMRQRVKVDPEYVKPNAGVALTILERQYPEIWGPKGVPPHTQVNVGVGVSVGGNVTQSFPAIDLSRATPEQIRAFTSGVDPAEVFADTDG